MKTYLNPLAYRSTLFNLPNARRGKALLIIGVIVLLAISAGAAAYWWSNRPIEPVVLNTAEQKVLDEKVEAVQERNYEAGGKSLVLNEREINSMLHRNTGLGEKVKLELANNAVHARISTDLDPELPIVGGKKLKARARFKLTDAANNPAIILDDLTVWGISLPNAWLAEMKGKNLISNLGIDSPKGAVARGIEDIQVENGKITIKLAE